MGSERSRRRSRDSESSYDSEYERERDRKKKKKKKITEDDIADYLAKKAQKKAMKVAKKLKSQSVSGYANESNPFGDSNFNEKFVWRKKIECDVTQGVPLEIFSVKEEKRKQRERMAEIEKVKKRWEERALEKVQHEEEMALLARERARAEFQDWEKKEEEFHFDQSKARSEIRLREDRIKPIDILSKHLDPSDDFDIEIDEPYLVFQGSEENVDREETMERVHRSLTPEEVDTGYDGKSTYDQPLSPEPISYDEIEEAEDAGSYSPELLYGEETEEAIDPEEDKAILERKRVAVLEEQQRRVQEALASRPVQSTEDNFELKAMKAMGAMEEGDAVFGNNDEVDLDSQVYWLHDKYRPRKPKYFNRVHTGYEWNKYNQTHYDHDNLPPKIVQGYKFNIFYPDLVDKTKAPVYTIEKDGDSAETRIIRFHAGPPYEDIAFRMVNKEWEYSHKKGFKCTFERGILHVYINFKRHRYRR